jgi:hypothetical protein
MKKALPEKMFVDDQSRMTALRAWVLDHSVTEIEMSELAVLELRRASARLGEAVDDIHGPPIARARHA